MSGLGPVQVVPVVAVEDEERVLTRVRRGLPVLVQGKGRALRKNVRIRRELLHEVESLPGGPKVEPEQHDS